MAFEQENARILSLMSEYLNFRADFITRDMLTALGGESEENLRLLLAGAIGLDVSDSVRDRALYRAYFPDMVRRLDATVYRSDPYYQAVDCSEAAKGRWTLKREAYKPYELFVWNDLKSLPDGRVLPQLGYFAEAFEYPAVLENGREWMTVTPNEIETMRAPINAARGRVLTYGLGLGYYAFMASRKPEVQSVTVIERDASVIALFQTSILPCFEHPEKLELVQADAFDFARQGMARGRYDVVFTDLWHDPSDGLALYQRMKGMEKSSPESHYFYWIEDTLKIYQKNL